MSDLCGNRSLLEGVVHFDGYIVTFQANGEAMAFCKENEIYALVSLTLQVQTLLESFND